MMNITQDHVPGEWPLGEIEPVLGDVESFVRMIGHLANSPSAVRNDEWLNVESRLLDLHSELDRLWKAAWDARGREDAAHRAELEAAKGRTAPGSPDAIEHVEALWRMLVATAQTVLERAAEAMPSLVSPPAEAQPRD